MQVIQRELSQTHSFNQLWVLGNGYALSVVNLDRWGGPEIAIMKLINPEGDPAENYDLLSWEDRSVEVAWNYYRKLSPAMPDYSFDQAGILRVTDLVEEATLIARYLGRLPFIFNQYNEGDGPYVTFLRPKSEVSGHIDPTAKEILTSYIRCEDESGAAEVLGILCDYLQDHPT